MLKKVLRSIFVVVVMFISLINVKALSETITLVKSPGKTQKYIAGVNFDYKKDSDGTYLYCLNMHKKTAQNSQANIVKNSNLVDGGVLHIIKNGYPNKTITGDKDKDYYITQTAVWWYLDEVKGTENLGEQFKKDGSDAYGLRSKVKSLVQEGVAHKNDAINTVKEPKISFQVSDTNMTMSDNYYVSKEIKANVENVVNYTINLKDAPEGTVIVKSDNTTSTNQKLEIAANQGFKIKVPVENVSSKESSIKIEATGVGEKSYEIAEYQPVNQAMQNVAKVTSNSKNVATTLNLSIASTKVSIIKIDSSTRQPLAGAVLAIKDSSGEEKARWTSTLNAHIIRNLPNGTYKLVEISAPEGYVLNTNESKFTISNTNREVELKFENKPKEVVVNITKTDQETGKPLAGATLQIKNSDGEVVYKFVSSEEAEVITDLENGTYTVEEVSAPEGYIKSDKKVSFQIDDEHLSHQIVFENAKEVFVPDTASASSLTFILGILISSLGFVFIKKNVKSK